MIRQLPITSIDRRTDARALNQESLSALSESIATVGLINPIRVREKNGRWEVSAGSHRLAACEMLGLADIECIIVDDDDLHAELSMIDENLCRNELSPAERASQTARRKAIYLELHPETAKEAFKGNQHVATDNLSVASFAVETAAATGKDERTVRRDAERGEKVIPEVIDLITGTKLDTGVYLDKLKRLPPNEQMTLAKRDLAASKRTDGEEKKTAKPHKASVPHEGKDEFDPLAARAFTPAAPDYGGLSADERIAELEENIRTLEGEYAELMAEVRTYRDIKMMLDRGGPLAVIAAKDEEIRVAGLRLYSESADKAQAQNELAVMTKKRDYWMGEAKRLGWRPPSDKSASSRDYDDGFYAAAQAEG